MTDLSFLIGIFISVIVVSLPAQDLSGDEAEERIYLLCSTKGEDLQLRWAPGSWQLYRQAMQDGFTLTKKSISDGDTIVKSEFLQIPPRSEFENNPNSGDEYAAAYHLLYEEMETSSGFFGNYAASESGDFRYGLLLYLADLNFSLAQYLKLGWTDKEYNPAHINIYEIKIPGSDRSATILGGFACIPSPLPIENLYSFPDDHAISIAWDVRHDPSGYVGFDVERSNDQVQWHQLNEQPVAVVEQGNLPDRELMIFKDSVPLNFENYFYRIRGINSFGEYGPYSKPIEAQARPRLNIGLPYISSTTNVGDTAINLRWQLEGKDLDQLEYLVVLRAEHPDSTFQALDTLDYRQTSYVDYTASRMNYYLIHAYDRNHRIYAGPLAHGQLPDKDPPLAPEKVEAQIDSSGKVTISWRSNQEADLSGYRVFYKRYLEDEIIQLTTATIKDTFYFHALPLDMLHNRGYYMVRAEDQVGNRSPDSDLSEVIVPDTICPSKPSIISTHSDISGCQLTISLSGSIDVALYILQRKNLNDTIWEDQTIILNPATLYQQVVLDSTLASGQEVQYRIIARDYSGNESLSNIAEGRRIDNKIRPAPQDAILSWDRRNKELVFSWLYPVRSDFEAIRIFKSAANKNRYYTDQYIRPGDLELIDSRSDIKKYAYRVSMAEKEEGFLYRIRIDFKDGATSGVADFRIN
ncbi:MAG: fibronectin type III domain-containing protein [Saprospiraceae bacterium]|nr:fibronectin type III domain-containing protein [Saprospiraceae bacterium]